MDAAAKFVMKTGDMTFLCSCCQAGVPGKHPNRERKCARRACEGENSMGSKMTNNGLSMSEYCPGIEL